MKNESFVGTVFDSNTPTIVRVSRIAGATVLGLCAFCFYNILAL